MICKCVVSNFIVAWMFSVAFDWFLLLKRSPDYVYMCRQLWFVGRHLELTTSSLAAVAETGVSCRLVQSFVRSTMSRAVATVFSLLCVFRSVCLAANDNTSTLNEPRPIDKGLEPLYVMTTTFLDVVHPESRGYALSDPRFDAGNCPALFSVIW